MNLAERIVDDLLSEVRWDDLPPAYAHIGADENAEIDNAARFPFNAHNYAMQTKKHHPKLWNAVKGSPYEAEYRRRFGAWIDTDDKRTGPLT